MKRRILLVEDDPAAIDVMRKELEFLGYEVTVAENGEEAIEKALAQNPDLIIMDLGLPGMNGIEATVALKQNPKTSQIPVIAHSAWKEKRNKALEAGMVEFLPKPTFPAVFREVLQKILHSQQVPAVIILHHDQ